MVLRAIIPFFFFFFAMKTLAKATLPLKKVCSSQIITITTARKVHWLSVAFKIEFKKESKSALEQKCPLQKSLITPISLA